MIYFTSDTHFGHEGILKHDQRPFLNTQDMENHIVHYWNRVVESGDTVYHLGDFGFGNKEENTRILSRLNGQKHLIVGNHDRKGVVKAEGWVTVRPYHRINVDLGGVHKQKICMMHYPITSWDCQSHGSWMLHGHCHGNLKDRGGKIMDVGCMNHHYVPISVEAISFEMSYRDIVYPEDHHQPK